MHIHLVGVSCLVLLMASCQSRIPESSGPAAPKTAKSTSIESETADQPSVRGTVLPAKTPDGTASGRRPEASSPEPGASSIPPPPPVPGFGNPGDKRGAVIPEGAVQATTALIGETFPVLGNRPTDVTLFREAPFWYISTEIPDSFDDDPDKIRMHLLDLLKKSGIRPIGLLVRVSESGDKRVHWGLPVSGPVMDVVPPLRALQWRHPLVGRWIEEGISSEVRERSTSKVVQWLKERKMTVLVSRFERFFKNSQGAWLTEVNVAVKDPEADTETR